MSRGSFVECGERKDYLYAYGQYEYVRWDEMRKRLNLISYNILKFLQTNIRHFGVIPP